MVFNLILCGHKSCSINPGFFSVGHADLPFDIPVFLSVLGRVWIRAEDHLERVQIHRTLWSVRRADHPILLYSGDAAFLRRDGHFKNAQLRPLFFVLRGVHHRDAHPFGSPGPSRAGEDDDQADVFVLDGRDLYCQSVSGRFVPGPQRRRFHIPEIFPVDVRPGLGDLFVLLGKICLDEFKFKLRQIIRNWLSSFDQVSVKLTPVGWDVIVGAIF